MWKDAAEYEQSCIINQTDNWLKTNVVFENRKNIACRKAKEVLDNFSEYLPKFKKIIPYDYNRMMMAIVQMEEKGLSSEQAQIEAFYANTRN